MNNASLGTSVPPDTPHAISVSLPTWRDNVGYEVGDKRVVEKMVSGYPRFFIHLKIKKLASLCEHKYTVGNESCMLFPTQKVAEACRSFIQHRSSVLGKPVTARLAHILICPDEDGSNGSEGPSHSIASGSADLHVVLFPKDAFPVAKEFWQHTGMGISSRFAEKCLSLFPEDIKQILPSSLTRTRIFPKGFNKHYSAVKGSKPPSPDSPNFLPTPTLAEDLNTDHTVYLEERYGRNLPLSAAASAKRALRRRVAGVLLCDNVPDCHDLAGHEDLVVGPSSRGVTDVSEGDVYLFPTGMNAIWTAHQLALATRQPAKSVCFGFPYTDTLKILQKWGPGCHFLGFGLDSDIDELEAILQREAELDPGTPPVLALFTEFPSNPLLRSANLPRLRALADKYDFLIIIDETIGNLVNVKVIHYADIVVSSLTKVFSGESNVMGGSLILNPEGPHYAALKARLNETFEDTYFDGDAIYMERNSRDFRERVQVINANTEAVCDFLRSRSLPGGFSNAAIKEVFYPKYTTRENYEHCRIDSSTSENGKGGGFGGLFSLTFVSKAASYAFFDNLPCFKGPSLGTNFTLACPFTILAHFGELDWAAQYGVEEGLVRISVGMEEAVKLLRSFEVALRAAEAADGAPQA